MDLIELIPAEVIENASYASEKLVLNKLNEIIIAVNAIAGPGIVEE